MKMEREKEREMELESAMYTNCLLLGLDPNILDIGAGVGSSSRVGLFRHSNPKLGEQLLFFILSSLRGPAQSAKDFDKVWPIFDPAQSREFRKVVQSIIIELESQGALPRSNSRVSSLATCCGPRFVELLWQLSLHALREVHQRNFSADLVSNPLPTSLTDVALSHAATLLPVTKGRIALERRRFLKNAETAVQRQATWSNLAHEMTAEFRGLCAEEAYLQQELEKLNELRNKVKMEGELGDELVSSSSQNHMVQRATRLWDSLLSRKTQHEVLASGPIEDLIAHREHRYRISGSALQAAMVQSSSTPDGEPVVDKNHKSEGSEVGLIRERHLVCTPDNDDIRLDDKTAKGHPTVDVAEVLRRWTHALQRIHRQSLQMEKTNDGEGPALLRSAQDGGSIGHAEALSSTLTEHRQHLASIQVLIDQLKEVAPAMHNSISELTEEVNSMSSNLPPLTRHHGRSGSPIQAQSSGRTLENNSEELVEMSSRLSSIQLEKASASPPALKLPPLFSVTPNSLGKGGNVQKRQTLGQSNQENLSEKKSLEQVLPTNSVETGPQDYDSFSFQNLKRSVREAALSSQSYNIDSSLDSRVDDSSEHYFVPMSGTGFSHLAQDHKPSDSKNKQLFTAGVESSFLKNPASGAHGRYRFDGKSELLNDFESLDDYDGKNGFVSVAGSTSSISDAHRSFYEIDEVHDQVFSPPLLMESTLLTDSYEDLLAPLSETESALMEHC